MDDVILISNESEARLLGALLDEEGIPHFLKRYQGPAFEGLMTYQDAWGQVDAPKEHMARIRELLEELRKAAGK
jgi:hypothetical protein